MTLIAFWCLAPNKINAQDSTAVQLQELVVTATKFPKNAGETAKVLTIIDSEQLSRSSGKDLSQILQEQSGLLANGANSNPGKDKSVFLQGAKSDYTIVMVDGVPLNDPSSLGGGAYDLRLIPVDQVERIEILKGSQSTLYGSDAIAGVINIITRKSGEKKLGLSANLAYGSYNSLKGSAGVMGTLKGFQYNIGLTRFQTDGFSEAKDSTGSANFDKDSYDQNAIQVSLGFNGIKSLSIRPFLRYNAFNGYYDAGAFADSKKNYNTSRLLNTGLAATYTLKRGAVNLLYGYDRTDRNYDSDFGLSSFKGRFSQTEIFWNHDISNHMQFLLGASRQEITMLDSTTTEKDPLMTLTSPYASLFVRNWKGFSAEIGGRYNQHSRFGNAFTYSINPAYWFNKQVKLFVNLSSGFKSPNLNQLYSMYGGNPDLKPERSQSLQGGVKFIQQKGNLDIRLVAFQRKIDDLIFYSFDPVTFVSQYINLNNQNDHGFEVEVNARVSRTATLRAFYNYVDGAVTDRSGTKDTTYNNLFRRPAHAFGLNVGYQTIPKMFISLNLKTLGQRSDLFFNLSTFGTENVRLSAYTLVDVYIEYAIWKDSLKIWVDVKNLLNQDYYEVYGYNTQGVNFMTGLNFKF